MKNDRMTTEQRKKQKEEFLAIQTYKEYYKRQKEFKGIDMKDKEIREHYYKELRPTAPTSECYTGELNTIVDDNNKCVIRTGIPSGMTRDEYIEFLRAKRNEYLKNQ